MLRHLFRQRNALHPQCSLATDLLLGLFLLLFDQPASILLPKPLALISLLVVLD